MDAKILVILLFLCSTSGVLCKPTESVEGRGVGSTIWGWLSYPFTGWGAQEADPPSNSPLLGLGSTTYGPYDNIEIGKRNITVWCNDHTCTTMKCDYSGCKNVTCNVYETDLNGECRVYNTITEEPASVPAVPPVVEEVPTAALPIPEEKVPEAPVNTIVVAPEDNVEKEEQPLELEKVLSSTVPHNVVQDNKEAKV
ncbi:uncharacterized protein LOC105387504 [Plutella xylostella]|uniref:uncharacterized protein LOC105387504 n=1 Tax=Plutella xylostella TaxID=51655 RepID=UPI0020331078|nr:uncharacterized protein LOC105387504 [Plutella xylostella]